jgi:hypothetical protein
MGAGDVMQQDNAISEFTQTFILDLGMQILKHFTAKVHGNLLPCKFKLTRKGETKWYEVHIAYYKTGQLLFIILILVN